MTAGIQYCVRFRQNQPIDSSSSGYIYGMPCPRRYKAMESVVVQALHYINMVTQSETYTTTSGDRLRLQRVCRIHVLVRFICTVMFN
jgi:hypothetical protein